ncbi:hypothetical protein HID58_019507 [Brassica napus]|uniref:V-SNARE coiled-coil homology domain-containing protein n=1 Tax=Brassica napus TaxID=3708 RepID=A0ABQ8DD21_BRANA|nr:hypothetical protein HID58_019507 [Brassica napus]
MSTIKVLVRHGSLLKKTLLSLGHTWTMLLPNFSDIRFKVLLFFPCICDLQDPVEADKLLKIQRELDETNIILHKTIYSVLARGEKLNSLVEKTSMMVFISMAPPSQFLLLRMEKPQRRLIMDSSLEVVGESRTYDFTL